ncbi:hypothetical protein PhaeoP66_03231 [Phaeobacter inhibens]|uniref:Uncharacterized protein n=2 Tax=Phaeobacter inhibens TaxID=221822 RepID=A0ABM6RHN0_9RHOB|nr:hypothetical protein PhaeoP66_03231 [Phaeobacter inhibens]
MADLAATHRALEGDEAGYRERLLQLTSDNARQARQLAIVNQQLRDTADECAGLRRTVADQTRELTQLRLLRAARTN